MNLKNPKETRREEMERHRQFMKWFRWVWLFLVLVAAVLWYFMIKDLMK